MCSRKKHIQAGIQQTAHAIWLQSKHPCLVSRALKLMFYLIELALTSTSSSQHRRTINSPLLYEKCAPSKNITLVFYCSCIRADIDDKAKNISCGFLPSYYHANITTLNYSRLKSYFFTVLQMLVCPHYIILDIQEVQAVMFCYGDLVRKQKLCVGKYYK